MDHAYDLRLMSSVTEVGDIPREGKHLVVVAAVGEVLHFRIFDGDGQKVVETDEKSLTGQAQQIADLKKQLQDLWPSHELTRSEKDRVIPAVASIVGFGLDQQDPDEFPTHASLLIRVRNHQDHHAWEQFTRRYDPMIRRWCRRWFRSEMDDQVQEVFVKLVRAMPDFEYRPDRGRFRGWLKTLTMRLMKELKKKSRVRGTPYRSPT